jgi:type I restriction enzyme S subunit
MRWWNRKTYGNHIGGIWVDWTLAWGCRSGAFESNLSPKLPFNGERVRLDQICSKGKSSLRLKDLQGGGEYAVYGASGVAGAIATYQNDRPYVAVVKDGAGVGRASLCEPRTSVLGTMQALIPSERVDCSYLLHLVRSLRLGSGYSGSTIPHIYFKDYGKLVVPLPPIPEQRNIAGQLDALEAAMRVCDEQAAVLSKLVKSRFAEMFGDGDFPRFRLDKVADVQGGLTKNRRRETLPMRLPYLRVANVGPTGGVDTNEMLSIGLTDVEARKTLLKTDDLLFVEGNGSKDQIGRVAIWDGSIDPCVHQNHLIRARLYKDVLPIFALTYFSSPDGRRQITNKAASTSGLFTLSTGKIKSLVLPVPPLSLQHEFSDFAAQVDKSRFGIQREGTSVLDFKAPVVWLGADDVRGGELRSKS